MDGVRATRKIHSKLNGQRDRGRERGAFGSDWEQEQLTEAEGIRITHQRFQQGRPAHSPAERGSSRRPSGRISAPPGRERPEGPAERDREGAPPGGGGLLRVRCADGGGRKGKGGTREICKASSAWWTTDWRSGR